MSISKIILNIEDAINILINKYADYVDKTLKPIINSNVKKKTINIYEEKSNPQWIEYGNGEDSDFIDTWPNKSMLLCWQCTLLYDTIPIGLPYKKEKEGIYYTVGSFCSFSCAYTWNKYNTWFTDGDRYTRENLLYEIYLSCGFKGEIFESNPKEVLLKYGGKLTDEEYKKTIYNKILISISLPPMISLNPIYNFSQCKHENIESVNISMTEGIKKFRFSRKKALF